MNKERKKERVKERKKERKEERKKERRGESMKERNIHPPKMKWACNEQVVWATVWATVP